MRKYFITGLVILLPLALTITILVFFVNLFTNPFVDVVRDFFEHYGLLQKGFLFLSAKQVQFYVSRLLILALLFFFTVLLGILTRWVIVHYFIRLGDYIFHRIPFVRAIYKTSQDVIRTIFTASTKSFKQVVMVPFPNMETHSLGLVTREKVPGVGENKDQYLVAVFVPTTPNPTSGFLIMFKPEDLVYLDMPVEEALKYIISCGVIQTPFKAIPREERIKAENKTASEVND
ncbi:MAG: hypothetical protein K940chlam7_00857 [Chlamydiae bacterium]|nr:hypothetical protein [Chlamydiota bacterium]